MADAAVIILAGTESHADTGRLVNGLEAAREFAETAGDDLALIFDVRKSKRFSSQPERNAFW